MVHYIKGDVTKSDCDIICHQVNCQGAMNSGVAKAIREKWPEVYVNYKFWCDREEDKANLLGEAQGVLINEHPRRYVGNLYAQYNYGYNGERYTNYEAFYNAIEQLANQITDAPKATIAFPYKIGCVRGGANWKIIRTMIEEVFAGRDVTFYYLNDDDLTWKEKLIVEEYNRKVPIDNE
jgi:O-acetyl-ADP-ribose deacetylase (regulator of RNase III)